MAHGSVGSLDALKDEVEAQLIDVSEELVTDFSDLVVNLYANLISNFENIIVATFAGSDLTSRIQEIAKPNYLIKRLDNGRSVDDALALARECVRVYEELEQLEEQLSPDNVDASSATATTSRQMYLTAGLAATVIVLLLIT